MTRTNLKILSIIVLAPIAVMMAYQSLHEVLSKNLNNELYSHIPLIPIICAYLLYRQRRELLKNMNAWYFPGLLIMGLGAGLFIYSKYAGFSLVDFATISTSSAYIFMLDSFMFLFGNEAFRKARFAVVLFSFVIPPPISLMNIAISILVETSTRVTFWIFSAIGVPFMREGPAFYLPGLSIEITRACSGMRSTIALLVICLLAGHLYLDKLWKRVLLAAIVLPISVLKNGVRIVTLYLLSYYIDTDIIMGGFLHNSGGFIFFFLGLDILSCFLWFLRKSDIQDAPRIK